MNLNKCTVLQVIKLINDWGNSYGLEISPPNPIYIDHYTFASIIHFLITKQAEHEKKNGFSYAYPLGPNNGIMFKGIEFILSPGNE